MTKQILAVLVALPLAAFAQAGPGPGPGAGTGPGRGRGMGPGANDPQRVERVERRMRLARTLGLAEALDLDAQQALKLGEQVAKFDDRRLSVHKQMYDAHQTLRRAARGDKVTPAEIDQAISRALEARQQAQQLDKETLAVVLKDLSPDKRARAFLFLEKFRGRFGPGQGGMGHGMMKHGRRGMGMGPGGGGMGMGPGMGPGACPNPDCPWQQDDDE